MNKWRCFSDSKYFPFATPLGVDVAGVRLDPMATRHDALRALIGGARLVGFTRTTRVSLTHKSYATTSGWRAWKGYGDEKPDIRRPSGSTLDASARDERHLNDLLVRSGHHERVLELVGSAGADGSIQGADGNLNDANNDISTKTKQLAFRPVNVATAFSRLRGALKRIPIAGGRRKEIARDILMEDERYVILKNMLIHALPEFRAQELATTVKALADIHAFAAHGRRPAVRTPRFDDGSDSQLALNICDAIAREGDNLNPRQAVMVVSALRGLGRVADRVVDDDGWSAIARSVARNSRASEDHNASAMNGGFSAEQAAFVAWSFCSLTWRSERRQVRNPEPLSKTRELLGRETWQGLTERILDGAETGKLGSTRLLAFAFHALTHCDAMRDCLLTMEKDKKGKALQALQHAVDYVGNTIESDGSNRLLVGWGPTPLRVASGGGCPSEYNAVAAGCEMFGLEAHDIFKTKPPTRKRKAVSKRRGSEDVKEFSEDVEEIKNDSEDSPESILLLANFTAPCGRLDLAALPPMPPKQ